jgi:menaquinol-cytochrome c reductase iron-sulfur subunit
MNVGHIEPMHFPEAEPAVSAGRRRFLISAMLVFAGLIGAGLGLPALLYVAVPPRNRNRQQWADAGDLSSLRPGAPEEVRFRRIRVDGWKTFSENASAWVVKSPGGLITAFSPQCTHLGCAYHWDNRAGQFLCPCHGSRFGIDGRVLAGPAPRPLDRYEVKLAGARLWLGPVLAKEPEAL